MKTNILFAVMLSVVFTACGPSRQDAVKEDITPRNTGIDAANAYNDLFLDSTAMEKYIAGQHLNDTLARRMRSFYNARNYEFAWFSSTGPSEQALGFRSLYNYSKDSVGNKALDNRLDALLGEDSLQLSARDPDIVRTELQLTRRFIQYFLDTYADARIHIRELETFIPMQRVKTLALADSVLSATSADSRRYESVNDAFKGMKAALKQYMDSVHARGDSLPPDTATKARVKQMLINMERMRWTPSLPEKGKLILVNIPEFRLHAWDGAQKAFDMDIVVGKEGHSTTQFSGDLNQIVFSPYWNLPRSIIRKEILPAMQRNPGYLEKKNMEVTGTAGGLPVIRQRPGPRNALGRVKFLFPNSFNIYFHDTPDKNLFNKENRAYSHGCIRLKDPVQMATFLLQDMPEWTPEKIDSAMNKGKEKWVRLKTPVPVIISYYTAWTNDSGQLQFAEDIYGHDKAMAARMFED